MKCFDTVVIDPFGEIDLAWELRRLYLTDQEAFNAGNYISLTSSSPTSVRRDCSLIVSLLLHSSINIIMCTLF